MAGDTGGPTPRERRRALARIALGQAQIVAAVTGLVLLVTTGLSLATLVAELFGTFALVFAGTGAIVVNAASGGQVTHVGVSLTSGWSSWRWCTRWATCRART